MSSPDPVMVSSYDYRLVVPSILISMLSAYAAVDLAGRVTAGRAGSQLAWLNVSLLRLLCGADPIAAANSVREGTT